MKARGKNEKKSFRTNNSSKRESVGTLGKVIKGEDNKRGDEISGKCVW